MRYAILADIHANLPALKAVLADSQAQKCERAVCLGDLVGYFNYPKECVELVRKSGMPCVKGNHDEYCSNKHNLAGFSSNGKEATAWTRAQLDQDEMEWLGDLDYVKVVDGFTLVHGTLDGPQRWGYVFNKLDAAASFPHQTTRVCFYGHTHVPLAFVQEPAVADKLLVKGGTYSKLQVARHKKYFVNPGSVGQPRDNNPKAAYAIYDTGEEVIELRLLDYDRSGLEERGGDGGDVTSPVASGPRRPVSGSGYNENNLN